MLKANVMKLNKTLWMAVMMLLAFSVTNCSEEEGDGDGVTPVAVIASFSQSVDEMTVTFTNESVGADTFAWDFGDGSTSDEENPVHTYAAAGQYMVTLTASNSDNTDDAEVQVTIDEIGQDPMTLLTGGSSKTWILSTELNGYRFGAIDDPESVWWGTNPAVAEGRPCFFDNEFTFTSEGNYTRNFNGGFWKEYLYFNACGEESAEGCVDVVDGLTLENKLGDDVSAWLNTDFTFSISGSELTVDGEGGYIGHYTSGRDTRDFGVVSEYSYTIVSVTEDQLVISGLGNTGDSNEDPVCLGYEAGGMDTEGPAHALFTMTFIPKP